MSTTTTTLNMIRTYTTSAGVVGAVYEFCGRRCSTFLGRVSDALSALKDALGLAAPAARELTLSERNQMIIRNGVEAAADKFRVKCAERASRWWKLPAAGESILIDGVAYVVDGQGKQWTSGKEMYCYLYLTSDAAPKAVAAPVAAPKKAVKAEALATERQVNYAVKLGATDPTHCLDALDSQNAYTRAQLADMTRSEISELIDTLKEGW